MNSFIVDQPDDSGVNSHVVDLAAYRRRKYGAPVNDAFAEIDALSAFVWSGIRAAALESDNPPSPSFEPPEVKELPAISNVIDLAARRADRDERKAVETQLRGYGDEYAGRSADFTAAMDHCAELSAKAWKMLEAAGYGRGRNGDTA